MRLAFLSNFTRPMLESGIRNSGLEGIFDDLLSTDQVQTFKPDPRAYQLGLDTFKVGKTETVFAAFAAWDAIGAKWFGYRTFWVNRLGLPCEELGVTPEATGSGLLELASFVKGSSA